MKRNKIKVKRIKERIMKSTEQAIFYCTWQHSRPKNKEYTWIFHLAGALANTYCRCKSTRRRKIPHPIQNKSMWDYVPLENDGQRVVSNVCNEAKKRWERLCLWQPEEYRKTENDRNDSPSWNGRFLCENPGNQWKQQKVIALLSLLQCWWCAR